jgi:3-methyladenine DNA glycosylase AlkC
MPEVRKILTNKKTEERESVISEAAKEAKRKYHREYRAKHKEQIAKNQARYWERKAAREAIENNAETERAE